MDWFPEGIEGSAHTVPAFRGQFTTPAQCEGLDEFQGDVDQPAAAVDSKSEGKEKPKPESEGRSQ